MNILENVFYGNTLQNWLISLAIIVGAIILNKCIVLLNRRVILKLTAKNNNQLDDILFETLERPITWAIILASTWFAVRRLHFSPEILNAVGKSYQILVVLNITWFFARFSMAIIDNYATKEDNKGRFDRVIPLIKRGLLIVIWLIGIVMALNNVGVSVATLLGTLGIGGIAFALAAQDTIKNIFGGVTIFIDQPFRIGDTIRYDSIEGTVEDIGLRSTRIRTGDKRIVTIANCKIMDAMVTNISSETSRRVLMTLGLTYDTNLQQMQQAIDILKAIPNQIKAVNHEDLSATFSDFGNSSLNITYTYFIEKGADIKETISMVNFEILRSFSMAGLNFAFPSQTVYVENR